MEHFVRVVMEKQETLSLNESVFPDHEIYESIQGATIIEIPLPSALSEELADDFADRLAEHMFAEGYEDFDIEISADGDVEDNEVTYESVEEFHEDYGTLWFNEDDDLDEAEYQGRKVKLGKPMQGDVKKFKVYVKNPKGNVVKVNFGSKEHKIKKSNPARRRSFRARHNCDNPGPRHKARYWSCRKW
jgi:hypothetical protein